MSEAAEVQLQPFTKQRRTGQLNCLDFIPRPTVQICAVPEQRTGICSSLLLAELLLQLWPETFVVVPLISWELGAGQIPFLQVFCIWPPCFGGQGNFKTWILLLCNRWPQGQDMVLSTLFSKSGLLFIYVVACYVATNKSWILRTQF